MEFENLKNYQRILLNQAYAQGIQQNEEHTKTCMQYIDRHKKIIEGLETLAHELSINCVVPIGKRALMKGKLKHTNEILVCIGDGYFTQYSSHQAIDLCNRRIKRSEELLKKLEQERNLLEVRQMLPNDYGAFEIGDSVDIIDHWDDKKLEDWRVEHRKKEKEYRQKLIELKQNKKKEIQTEDDLFARLDELELEEELADELNRLEDEHQSFYGEDLEGDEMDNVLHKESEDEEEDGKGNISLEEEQKQGKHNDNISNEKISTIVKELVNNAEIQNNVQSKENLSEEVNMEDVNKSIQTPAEKRETTVPKDNRVNRKFEVSIIKEDEVKKVLERPSMSLDSQLKTYELSALNEQLNKQGTSSNLFNKSLRLESSGHYEKLKGSGRRVSFAEPHFIECQSSCNQDNDFEKDNNSDQSYSEENSVNETDNDDTIKIDFKHSEAPALIIDESRNDIISPQDIYRIFSKPKSILKKSKHYKDIDIRKEPLIEVDKEESSDEKDDETLSEARSTYNIVVKDIQERNLNKTLKANNKPINKNKPISKFAQKKAMQQANSDTTLS